MSEKIFVCKACGQQVAKNAKTCPHCGAKVKKTSPISIGIIAVVAIAIIAGAGGNDKSEATAGTTPTKAQTNNTTAANIEVTEGETTIPVTTESKASNAYGVGDTAELKDVVVSLLSVTESDGSSFNLPSEGNIFVLCEFEIQNNTKEELTVSSMLSFEAYCDEYACNYSIGALLENDSTQLDGTVAPGKKMKGSIGYEIPADWTELEIHFSPNVWFGKDIVFIAVNE